MKNKIEMLDRNNTQLIIVDMQEPFLRNISERETVIKNVRILVEASAVLGVPITTTLQYREKMGDVIPEIAEVLPNDDRIDKTTFSCCGVKPFEPGLSRRGRWSILLCGVETHICVSQTAHDLIRLGYEVHIAADAVGSRKESDYIISLERMQQAGVVVSSTEMAIFELLRDAAAPEFKKILELVK